MTEATAAPTGRRLEIAEAAIALIAREGLRSLTHRAIDRRMDWPTGTASYYARSRRDLLGLVVRRLATATHDDLDRGSDAPPQATPEAAARLLAAMLEMLARRPADHRARFALLIELADDPELHAMLTTSSPVRVRLLAESTRLLAGLGVDQPEQAAPGMVALMDGLLFERLVASGRAVDNEQVIRAYLTGLRIDSGT